ncbi:MAG: flagellar M-ring protein FliF C-terminal domain-containing protein, partial [candidate division Zixibacteria bacterium]|nr:flagellar M-ring protein FliF C-terminal domain-containing protein [candidate division Zixibacteria bacterium]
QQLERTSETYDPNSPSVRSEERTKTTASSSEKSEETNESGEENNSETTITNYELNKTIEHMINEIGSIDRLSIAVMVDGNYNTVVNDAGETEKIYQPRSQEELDRLAAIVKNAVGFDQQRNDQIEMVNLSFDREDLQMDRDMLDSMYQREFYMDIAKKFGYVLVFIFLLLYLKKKSKNLFGALKRLMPPPLPPKPVMQPMPVIKEEPVKPIEPEMRKPRLIDQMQETAKERPDEIAKVIKTLMVE